MPKSFMNCTRKKGTHTRMVNAGKGQMRPICFDKKKTYAGEARKGIVKKKK